MSSALSRVRAVVWRAKWMILVASAAAAFFIVRHITQPEPYRLHIRLAPGAAELLQRSRISFEAGGAVFVTDGKEIRKLTHSEDEDTGSYGVDFHAAGEPSLSPDGSRIAYLWGPPWLRHLRDEG
jgi:hypothetical protein